MTFPEIEGMKKIEIITKDTDDAKKADVFISGKPKIVYWKVSEEVYKDLEKKSETDTNIKKMFDENRIILEDAN